MFVNIDISSKNKKSLHQFINLLNNLISSKTLNLKNIYRYIYRIKSRKILTVLKSPHVNKTAQEQFEYSSFSIKILVESFQIFKVLVVLKKLEQLSYFDVVIRIKFVVDPLKNLKYLLSPTVHKLKLRKIKNTHDKSLVYYLKLFDAYGSL